MGVCGMFFHILSVLLTYVHGAKGTSPRTSQTSPRTSQTELYFGNGCFFHQQHLFITGFEMSALDRSAANITSIAAYAGGQAASRLCYHNSNNVSDYGELGHAEVVSVAVPSDRVYDIFHFFFTKAFQEIAPGIWSRNDVFDVGGEYRSIIGLPGGLHGPLASDINKANQDAHKMKLLPGQGSDPDTLYNDTVYVMDSTIHAPTQAEVCLQFHDDAPAYSPPYPASYHALGAQLLAKGRLHNTTCPPNYIC